MKEALAFLLNGNIIDVSFGFKHFEDAVYAAIEKHSKRPAKTGGSV